MIFSWYLPLPHVFQNLFMRGFERFSVRFFLITCLVIATLTHRVVAVDDVYWDEAKLRVFSEQALSATALAYQAAFLAEASSYSSTRDVAIFIQSFDVSSSQLRTGQDGEIRPIYVAAQGDFEKAMALHFSEGKITHLIGIIHTPTPATPLCTRGDILEGLVDPSLLGDERCLYTVMKRPEIVRDYMEKGALLVAAYPESGIFKRTEEQRAIFQETKEAYPENLMDLPLSCEAIEGNMIGATYLFRTEAGDWMAFAIMASQANAPQDGKTWGMWFGPIGDPLIYARVHSLFNYLHTVQDQDLSSILFGIY